MNIKNVSVKEEKQSVKDTMGEQQEEEERKVMDVIQLQLYMGPTIVLNCGRLDGTAIIFSQRHGMDALSLDFTIVSVQHL